MRVRALAIALALVIGSSSVAGAAVRVTPAAMRAWTKVAVCEEGGWHNAHGPTYYGALGWLDSTWQTFRRSDFPRRMDHATKAQQVWAAMRFARHYGFIPDQHGCVGAY